jgi:hypothetical protein
MSHSNTKSDNRKKMKDKTSVDTADTQRFVMVKPASFWSFLPWLLMTTVIDGRATWLNEVRRSTL